VRAVPVAGSLACRDELDRLPAVFDVTLEPEPDNPYYRQAVAVKAVDGGKIGYLTPDVGRQYFDALVERSRRGDRTVCRAVRDESSAATGVFVKVDLSGIVG
jgi:hypothetical protein